MAYFQIQTEWLIVCDSCMLNVKLPHNHPHFNFIHAAASKWSIPGHLFSHNAECILLLQKPINHLNAFYKHSVDTREVITKQLQSIERAWLCLQYFQGKCQNIILHLKGE